MGEALASAGVSRPRQPDDRVRRNTPDRVNRRLDRDLLARVRHYAGQPQDAIDARLRALEQEWDIERWLELNASALTVGSLVLAAVKSRAWLLPAGVIAGFLLQHATQGWCPPVALFRRLGVRTRQEIDSEVFALKALRGDFVRVPPEAVEPARRAQGALEAVGRSE